MIGVGGEALIDFVPLDAGGRLAYLAQPGGSPCNVAVGLARLGKTTVFVGKLSRDRFGDELYAHLKRNGVDLRLVVRGREPTALAFVVPDGDGGHDFLFYGNGTAEQNLTAGELPDELPHDLSALHFGSYSLMLGSSALAYERLMTRESGSRVISLDPNVRPALVPDREQYRRRIESLLPLVTLVKASIEDLDWLYPDEHYPDVARHWLELGPPLVVVTRGAGGCVALTADLTVGMPAVGVDVKDAVGAGDAFTSALLARLDDQGVLHRDALASLPADAMRDVLSYANTAAAVTCTRRGADPPTRRDIEEFNPDC